MAATSRKRKADVDIEEDHDLKNVEFETSEEVSVISSFDKMGLNKDLLRGIYSFGRGMGTLPR